MYKAIALFFLLASNDAIAFKPTPLVRRLISTGHNEMLISGSNMQMVAGGAERSQDEYYEGNSSRSNNESELVQFSQKPCIFFRRPYWTST
jgi:hypothetical protein